jgi:hypothetical protein
VSRTVSTFIVTALAIASLGLAGTAQAEVPEQGVAIGEPTPGQLPPETQADPDPEPEPGPVAEDPEAGEEEMGEDTDEATGEDVGEETGEVDYTSPAYFKTKEALERFKRYCKMKDAEPSHSDKKFCEDFVKHNPQGGGGAGSAGTGTPTTPTNPGGEGAGTDKPDTERTDDREETQQAAEKADKGSLPFTGLEIWQLGLLGIVLVGGGFGARRLLTS